VDALPVLERHPLPAPDLIVADCANIPVEKVRRGEMARGPLVTANDRLRRRLSEYPTPRSPARLGVSRTLPSH
jgi:hypothetical protein